MSRHRTDRTELHAGFAVPIAVTDWLDIAARLTDAGKEVVLSTLALLEANSDLSHGKVLVLEGAQGHRVAIFIKT